MSNSLDPDQARHFVGPDLGLNCLQGLSAEDTSSQGVNLLSPLCSIFFVNHIALKVAKTGVLATLGVAGEMTGNGRRSRGPTDVGDTHAPAH